jgi:putative FmdB family regulatory protein
MPIYEYRCANCRRRVSVLVRSFSQSVAPACDRCGGTDLTRLVSTFAVGRSWGESLDSVPDSAFDDVDESDPKAMSRWMKRLNSDMGGELTPELDQMAEEMASEPAGEDGNGLLEE